MAKSSLTPNEPEALSSVPLLLKASRIFRNHMKVLLTAAFTLTALPLMLSFSIVAFGHDRSAARGQPAGRGPPRPAGPSDAVILLSLVSLLVSTAATAALIAVVVHVVVVDHLGRTPGSLWLAVRRSFCRLGATLLAHMGAMMGLLMALYLVGGCVIVLLFISGYATPYPILFACLLLLLIATPILILVSMSLSLAEHASVIEGRGVWGFAALSRSWSLSKGVRPTLLTIFCLELVVTVALIGPFDVLAANLRLQQSGFAVAASVVVALLLGALLICQGVYFKVVWCLLYLSARKKAEPDFGLTTLQQYFEADPSDPGHYALMGLTNEEV